MPDDRAFAFAALAVVAVGALAVTAGYRWSRDRLAREHYEITRDALRLPAAADHVPLLRQLLPAVLPACERPGCCHPAAPAAYVVTLADHPGCGAVLMCTECRTATAGPGHQTVCPECGGAGSVEDYQVRARCLARQP